VASQDLLLPGGWRAAACRRSMESKQRPGGKIMSTQQDGYLTERAAAMVLNFRPEVVELVERRANRQDSTLAAAKSRRYLLPVAI